MKSYNLPNIQEPQYFSNFISNRARNTQNKLNDIHRKLPYYYRKYNISGKDLHTIKEKSFDEQDRDLLITIYESYTSQSIINFRKILFDHIQTCPYCGLGESSELDHYLPKKKFGEYSLFSKNLIPSCGVCNSDYKGEIYKIGSQRIFFHPYIDSINHVRIIRASVLWTRDGVKIKFGIKRDNTIDSNTHNVLKKHFSTFDLNKRYAKKAIIYFNDMLPRFRESYGINNHPAFVEAMNSKYRDSLASNGINHWQTALLFCLKNDLKFMNGDFLALIN